MRADAKKFRYQADSMSVVRFDAPDIDPYMSIPIAAIQYQDAATAMRMTVSKSPRLFNTRRS